MPKKCAENYPELLHPVHGNDKILTWIIHCKLKITIALKFSSKMQMMTSTIHRKNGKIKIIAQNKKNLNSQYVSLEILFFWVKSVAYNQDVLIIKKLRF